MFWKKKSESPEEMRFRITEELKKEIEVCLGVEYGPIVFEEVKRLASSRKEEGFKEFQDTLFSYVFHLKINNLDLDSVMLTLLTLLSEKGWSIGWPEFKN